MLAAPYLGDAVLLVRQMRENNANFPLVMGMATGFSDLNFRKRAGSAGDYIMDAFTYHDTLPGPENKKFVKVFQKKYGFLPDAHHQWGYTDMYVIANTLQRAASTDPAVILKALKETDMMTPCGRVKFGPDGQNHEYKGIVIQWLNEKIEVIWPKKYATAKPVYPMPTWDRRK